jgi:hypothetical protein
VIEVDEQKLNAKTQRNDHDAKEKLKTRDLGKVKKTAKKRQIYWFKKACHCVLLHPFAPLRYVYTIKKGEQTHVCPPLSH